jgi:undecaprenyl pyrophosphate phosphatase UppP
MTVQTSMNFIGWLMRKWFSGLIRLNKWWTRKVQDEPGEAFFLMLLFSGVIFILAFVPGLLIMEHFGVDLVAPIWIVSLVIWVGNYLRIIMTDQYQQFKEEQNRMFNEIKHSDRRYR